MTRNRGWLPCVPIVAGARVVAYSGGYVRFYYSGKCGYGCNYGYGRAGVFLEFEKS